MEDILTTMKVMRVFFGEPNKGFLIREVARIVRINHATIRQYLAAYTKQGLLSVDKTRLYPEYRLNPNKKSLNLKLYFNMEKLRESGLIEYLEKAYDYPVIVLFGSYSKAIDDEMSDVDICILTNIDKHITLDSYAKKLNRNVSLHVFDSKAWQDAKKKNPNLVNNICNGITLSGQLEVL